MSDLPLTEVEQQIINEEFHQAMTDIAKKWGIELTINPINFDEGPSKIATFSIAALFIGVGALFMFTLVQFGIITI